MVKQIPLAGATDKGRQDARKEAELMAEMAHPNIVQLLESWEESGHLLVVMEHAGQDLADRLEEGPLPEEEALPVLAQLTSGLHFLHARRTLHRDVKARNAFIRPGGRVVLGDLGLSRVLDSSASMAESNVGTPLYLSPEQCRGLPYGFKSDMWSLGCLAYQLLAGRPPFVSKNSVHLASAIAHDDPPDLPSSVSDSLRALVSRMLRKDPEHRPTAAQLLESEPVRSYTSVASLNEQFALLRQRRMKDTDHQSPRKGKRRQRARWKNGHVQERSPQTPDPPSPAKRHPSPPTTPIPVTPSEAVEAERHISGPVEAGSAISPAAKAWHVHDEEGNRNQLRRALFPLAEGQDAPEKEGVRVLFRHEERGGGDEVASMRRTIVRAELTEARRRMDLFWRGCEALPRIRRGWRIIEGPQRSSKGDGWRGVEIETCQGQRLTEVELLLPPGPKEVILTDVDRRHVRRLKALGAELPGARRVPGPRGEEGGLTEEQLASLLGRIEAFHHRHPRPTL